MDTEIIIATARACMPACCFGGSKYGKVAIMRVDAGSTPRMISIRARGVHEIIAEYDRLHAGTTALNRYPGPNTAFSTALRSCLKRASEISGCDPDDIRVTGYYSYA